jgi:ribosomal protein L34E
MRREKLTMKERSFLGHASKTPGNPKLAYCGGREEGFIRPEASEKLERMADKLLGVSQGRPAKTAKRDLRKKRPSREVLGQQHLEHTPSRFEGEAPRLGYLETQALFHRLPIAERERVLRELAVRG